MLDAYQYRERLSVADIPDVEGEWLFFKEGELTKQFKTPILDAAPPPWPSAVVN